MPRDGSGTYTLPAGNPVVTAETIASAWANNTMADIATAITDSLSRSGQGGMLTAFRFADGTVNAPGATWVNETVSGWYRAASQDFRYSINQADVFRLTPGVAAVFSGAAWRTLFHANNDGAGSGLDADLLDGSEGAFYRDAGNLNAGVVPDARFPATLPAVSGANLTNLDAADLATGTVPTARLGGGSASSTTFLRGDQTWAAVEADSVAVKSGDTSRSSTTTPTDDPHLTFSVVAGARYALDGLLLFDTTGAGNMRARFGNVSLTLWAIDVHGARVSAGFFAFANAGSGSTDAIYSVSSSGELHVGLFSGTVLVAGASGTLALQWAQGTSDAAALNLRAGSWLRLRRLS